MDKYPCEAKQPTACGWVPCGDPAVERWRYGCVHEHVIEGWTCLFHRPVSGQVGCRRCHDAGHDCPVVFQLMKTDIPDAPVIVMKPK